VLQDLLSSFRPTARRFKYDPVTDLAAADRAPLAFGPAKYDMAGDIIAGLRQQGEGGLLEQLPEWDPLRQLLLYARQPAAQRPSGPGRFDPLGQLFSGLAAAEPPSGTPKFDLAGRLLKGLLLQLEPHSARFDAVAQLLNHLSGRAQLLASGAAPAARYDPLQDLLALEAVSSGGGAGGYDPLAVMKQRGGGDFRQAVSAFEVLSGDQAMQRRHRSVFALLGAAAEAARVQRAPARYCPAWSVLHGPDGQALVEGRGQLGAFLDEVAAKYDPLYRLLKGHESEEVVAALCTLSSWLQRAEQLRRGLAA
jgi:hypothetical protein